MNAKEELPVSIRFDARGLVPVITQDQASGQVLMLAWANEQAVTQTLRTGQAHYYSRSRQELWHKGATSGHTQQVHEVLFDCDEDALLYRVVPNGPACHTGETSCFHRSLNSPSAAAAAAGASGAAAEAITVLDQVVADRLRNLPAGSYVTRLHEQGVGYVSQKVVEEAGEVIVAALQQDDAELSNEAADLLFHLTVLLHERNLSLDDVGRVLLERHRASG